MTRSERIPYGFILSILLLFSLSGCSKKPTKPLVDVTAPAAVADLVTTTKTVSSIALSWTAPGDDGAVGTATSYDMRYSTSPITQANFGAASQVSGEPSPAVAGTEQSVIVAGLVANTTYYFSIKTADEVPNVSGISNVATGSTLASAGDVTPPASVVDLATTTKTDSSITLTWTSPGDDGAVGTATSYDLRYSMLRISPANFGAASQVSGEPNPLVAGAGQSIIVAGLAANTTYYFALETSDEVPNLSGLSNVATGATLAASAPLFSTAQSFASGMGPRSVVIADFNGDGKSDLATANFFGNSVSVLLGAGNGTFGSKTDYAAGDYPYCVSAGTFDNDFVVDLVATNFYDNTVSVLFGNGSGGFGAASTHATGTTPLSVAIGDLNTDGVDDLAVADNSDGAVSVLIGYQTGDFFTKFDVATGSGPSSVRIEDVSGDGFGDLVFTNQDDNTVSVRTGDGSGFSYGARQDAATGSNPWAVAVGDLNGDGKPDVVTANGGTSSVSVLLGNGNGTLGAKTDFGTGADPRSVAIGDLDGDGKLDLVTANYTANSVSVLLGNGDGTFRPSTEYATGKWANSVVIADLNGDGKRDLAVADYGDNAVSVLLNTGASSTALRVTDPVRRLRASYTHARLSR